VSAAISRRLRGILALDDFEAAARRHLPLPIFGYVSGAAETSSSVRGNRAAFEDIHFLPRVLNNVSQRSQAQALLGREYASPFGIAPMGISALTAFRGDVVLAESAAKAGIPMIMSGSSLTRMEDVARAAPGSWFQAYLPPTTERIASLVDRVAGAGFETLVVTVDSAVRGNVENYSRSGFTSPLRPGLALLWQGITHPRWTIGTFMRTLAASGMPHFENADTDKRTPIVARNVVREFSGRSHLDWEAIARIRGQWRHKLVIKGILHPADALKAKHLGMDGVIVSNHGGRQLDGAVSPLRVLPAIRAAVGDGFAVMVDSGFRRGTDVLKALALGADFVFVGRPFNYAAAIAGAQGVAHAIGLLASEIDADMGLLGINRLGELGPAHLVPRDGPPDRLGTELKVCPARSQKIVSM
jgi:L-lactate dehydrogenase (cytochrome)